MAYTFHVGEVITARAMNELNKDIMMDTYTGVRDVSMLFYVTKSYGGKFLEYRLQWKGLTNNDSLSVTVYKLEGNDILAPNPVMNMIFSQNKGQSNNNVNYSFNSKGPGYYKVDLHCNTPSSDCVYATAFIAKDDCIVGRGFRRPSNILFNPDSTVGFNLIEASNINYYNDNAPTNLRYYLITK